MPRWELKQTMKQCCFFGLLLLSESSYAVLDLLPKRMVPPTVCCTLLHQLIIQTTPHSHGSRPVWSGKFPNGGFPFRLIVSCVKLTTLTRTGANWPKEIYSLLMERREWNVYSRSEAGWCIESGDGLAYGPGPALPLTCKVGHDIIIAPI